MENNYGGVKTRQQMADEYGVCRKTFNKLLRKKQIKIDRGLISPKDQSTIYRNSVSRTFSKIPIFSQKFPIIPNKKFDFIYPQSNFEARGF